MTRKKQPTNRKHNFSDADLYLQCTDRIKLAVQDIASFEQYAYDKARLQAFHARCERFKELPDDDELVGDQMITTEKKTVAADALRNAIRSLMTRVAMKFNNRTGRYRKFGTAKMGDMTDAQLIFCGRRVIRVARAQMPFIEEVGVNEKILERISAAVQTFENAVNIQQDRVADRDIAVENRVDFANELYDEMVVISNIGKDVWIERDPVRYEQYCIYESNNAQKIARKIREKEA